METIDLRGISCTTIFVQAKLLLEDIDKRATVAILLDDGEQVKTIPRSLKAEGHKLLGLTEDKGFYVLTLEKGDE